MTKATARISAAFTRTPPIDLYKATHYTEPLPSLFSPLLSCSRSSRRTRPRLAKRSSLHTITFQHSGSASPSFLFLSNLLHLGQAFMYRAWYMLPTAFLCGILEIVDWLARLSSSNSPQGRLPYEIQMTATIIGPLPAANFLTLGRIISLLGPQDSQLTPRIWASTSLL
ncbi:hypothetical protein C8R47DRAFT_644101 [Mycena vitilis]|nr:hypothetical protein C8R47DRAFT_644101 [Mycena vitilis]